MWWFIVWLLFSAFVVDVISLSGSQPKESSCSYETDSFSLWWMNDGISNDITFKMMARSKLKNFWSGFFLGDQEPIDAIGAFVQNEQIGLMDGHVTGNGIVKTDNVTNVQYLMTNQQNHVLMAEFTRPSTTSDLHDADLSSCITFFLPSEAISMNAAGQVMVPQRLTKRRVCNIAKTCRKHRSSFVKRSDTSVCEYIKGMSSVTWRAVGGNVEFVIGQNAKRGKWWSAIGVGQSMENLKTAIAFMENGVVKYVGGYQTQGYKAPKSDPLLNPVLNTMDSKVNNGRSFVSFALPMKVFDLYSENTGCVTLQIAVLAGQWANKYEVKKHEKIPEAVLVCGIEHCSSTRAPLAFAIDDAPETAEKSAIKVYVKEIKGSMGDEEEIILTIKLPEGTGNVTVTVDANEPEVVEGSGDGSGEEMEGSGIEEGSGELENELELSSAEEEERNVMNKTVTANETIMLTVLNETKTTTNVIEKVAVKAEPKVKSSTAITLLKVSGGTPLVLTKTLTDEVSKIIHDGCEKDHTDLFICESYFNNYLYEVSNWAKVHDQILEEHMWKVFIQRRPIAGVHVTVASGEGTEIVLYEVPKHMRKLLGVYAFTPLRPSSLDTGFTKRHL